MRRIKNMNIDNIKDDVPGSILKYAVPSIVAMVLTSLISVVDGFYIGNFIGSDGLAASNIGLPILNIFLGVGIMVGVGGCSISSRLLGARDIKKSNDVFNQTVVTSILSLITVSIIMFLFFDVIIGFFNVSESVISYFKSYYKIMLFVYPIMMLNTNLGVFMRADGSPRTFMSFTVVFILLNAIFDYVFIKIFNLGMSGIALASLISVSTGFVLTMRYYLTKSNVFKFKKFTFSKEVFSRTYLNGSSEFLGQFSLSITMFVFNYVILREVGTLGVAAFTVAGYVSYIFNMVVIGFGQGASPIVGYSFGAKEVELSKKVRKTTNMFVFALGVVVLVVLSFTSELYSSLFVKSKEVQTMVSSGIIIYAIAFVFIGMNIVTSFYFTSVGKALESAIISASRGLVVLLACIFLLPALWRMTGVWLVAPVTEVITILFTFILVLRHDKTLSLSKA